MSTAATVLYVWSTLQDLAVTIISAIFIISIVLGLWYVNVLRKRRNAKNRAGVVK